MADCINALTEWTGKARATVVYDSTVDEFTGNGLFRMVMGKPNVALIGFTIQGDVFGGFYTVAATKQDRWFNDPNIFAFSFESHGRCETPQRFVVKEGLREKAHVYFLKNNIFRFVEFWVAGAGGFYLGDERSDSNYWNVSRVSDAFEGLQGTTLTGKNVPSGHHHCARLVAVELE